MTTKKGSPRSIKKLFSYGALALVGIGGTFALSYEAMPSFLTVSYSFSPATVASSTTIAKKEPHTPLVQHIETPKPLKAIYMSQCVVGTPSFRDELVEFVEDTELNALVIDIKDFSGKISFPTSNSVLSGAVSDACGARDMKEFIKKLHSKDIYVIGRITVFQDPHYTSQHPELAVQSTKGGVWKDNKGLAFVDVGARPFWGYIVELGKEAYALGFDELNFDYVRYPSDGPMSEALYTHSNSKSKPEMLEEFFKYLTGELRQTGAVLSADLFGMTTTNEDDLNIGQVLERALPYFDGVYPMVYPSHYPSGFRGYDNVNQHSYDIVNYSMHVAAQRAQATTTAVAALTHERIGTSTPALYKKPVHDVYKLRPWLQSFDYPVTYTPEMVEEQIRATEDAGLDSWLFWDAANKYKALRDVLKKTD